MNRKKGTILLGVVGILDCIDKNRLVWGKKFIEFVFVLFVAVYVD